MSAGNPVENLWKTASPTSLAAEGKWAYGQNVMMEICATRRLLRRLDDDSDSLHDTCVGCGERVVERSSPPPCLPRLGPPAAIC